MTKSENLPRCLLRLVIVDRKHDRSATARVQLLMSDGSYHSITVQDWPSGRPDEPQLADLQNTLLQAVTDVIVGTVGIQGVIASPL